MANEHLVVDGSNIATEGRTAPSLAQLDDAVHRVHPATTTSTTSWSWSTRPSPTASMTPSAPSSKRPSSPVSCSRLPPEPSGAVTRSCCRSPTAPGPPSCPTTPSRSSTRPTTGSSTTDRLWGGKPVPGVGWVFVPRVPVKGPVSRRAFRDARNKGDASEPARRQPARKQPARKTAAPQAAGPQGGRPQGARCRGLRCTQAAGPQEGARHHRPLLRRWRPAAQLVGRPHQHAARVPQVRDQPTSPGPSSTPP